MTAVNIPVGPGLSLGPGQRAVVVAEIGQNHNGRRELAEQLIDAAAWAGADAVKFTKRDLDCELSLEAHNQPYPGRNSFGATYGEHRRALELSGDDLSWLAARARRLGLAVYGTACDVPSADLLAELKFDVIKIASRDLANLPLLNHVAHLSPPVFISTGMSGWTEIDEAAELLASEGSRFVVFQCTSLYPTPPEQAHLRSLPALAKRYDVPVGFSDHTLGTRLAPVAVALGACAVEKHLTLDRTLPGTDHECSLEPELFRQMIEAIREVEAALGSQAKPVAPGVDQVRRKLGRSLVARVSLQPGTRIEEYMLTLKCPGDGISWHDRQQIIGRRLRRAVAANELLKEEHLELGHRPVAEARPPA